MTPLEAGPRLAHTPVIGAPQISSKSSIGGAHPSLSGTPSQALGTSQRTVCRRLQSSGDTRNPLGPLGGRGLPHRAPLAQTLGPPGPLGGRGLPHRGPITQAHSPPGPSVGGAFPTARPSLRPPGSPGPSQAAERGPRPPRAWSPPPSRRSSAAAGRSRARARGRGRCSAPGGH